MNQKDTYFDYINFAYGIGAAIVIIGAMFKFLGWDYANEFFLVGLTTEAVVFTVSAFEYKQKKRKTSEKPKIYKWEKLFPELISEVDPTEQTSSALQQLVEQNNAKTGSVIQSLEKFNECIENLNIVTAGLSEKVNQISSHISTVEANTLEYSKEMEALKERIHKTNEIQENHIQHLSISLPAYETEYQKLIDSLSGVNENYLNTSNETAKSTSEYLKEFGILKENLDKINQVYQAHISKLEHSSNGYEKEFSSLNGNLSKVNSFYFEHVSKNNQNVEDFEKEFASLKENLSRVNSFYTDMLGAVGRVNLNQ